MANWPLKVHWKAERLERSSMWPGATFLVIDGKALISQCAGHPEHRGVADPRDAGRVVRIGDAAGRPKHVLEIRRQKPARLHVCLVDHLDQRLIASHRARQAVEEL